MSARVVVEQDFTFDVQNRRRYGTYVRAGQIVTLTDAEAAAIVRAGAGRIAKPKEEPRS
jgi:hypothetical protein